MRTLMVCALALFAPVGSASAGFPPFDPSNSDCTNAGPASLGSPCVSKAVVYVTGNSGGTPDPLGQFCVTVRDYNNAPINTPVVLDFTDCDLQLCSNQLDPDVVVDCVARTVSKVTDVNGVACFAVQGKSRSPESLGCGGGRNDCVEVYAYGVFMCGGDAPTFDLVSGAGEEGLNPNDLSEFAKQWLVCGTNNRRCNYECSNLVLDPNDLSYFIAVWLAGGGSTSNCAGATSNAGPKCP